MRTSPSSHQALVRYAGSQIGVTLFIILMMVIMCWREILDGVPNLNWVFLILCGVVSSSSTIFFTYQLFNWGETVHEQSFVASLPLAVKLEIKVPKALPLRVMMLIRNKYTLSALIGSVKILSLGKIDALAEKRIGFSRGINRKVVLLTVTGEKNPGQIIVDLDLDWRHQPSIWFPFAPDSSKDKLVCNIIVCAQRSESQKVLQK